MKKDYFPASMNFWLKAFLLTLLVVSWPYHFLNAQTTVFYDNFNRDLGTSPVTNGGTPTMTWTSATTATSASIYTTNAATVDPTNYVLQIYTGATAAAGRSYVMGSLSTCSTPFATTLHSNTGTITWTFNMKTNRSTALSGFDASNYGSAVILACDNANPTDATAKGYAVVLVKGTTNNAVKLVRFASGLILNSNVTTIIGPSADLAAMTRYVSVKVVYDPLTDTWSLYSRDDGSTTDPTDPTTGTLTQVGTSTVNTTHTSVAMTSCGFLWNHSNGAGSSNKAAYDNFRIQVTALAPSWTSNWPKVENITQTGFTAKVNSSAAGNAYYAVLPGGATAPSPAQVKAGKDASGTALASNLKGTVSIAAASTEYTAAVSGLTGNTTYDVYFVAEDAVPNLQSSCIKVSATTTPPIAWTSGWPKAELPTTSGFTAKVNTNIAGTSYYVVLPSGAAAPSSAQVKAGNDATDAAAIKSGSISNVAGSTEYTSAVTGLSGATTYDVYFVAQDGSAILQSSPVLATITTTSSASAPTVTTPTATSIGNNSAILGGNITSDGGSAITARGTVWKTSTGVSITDNANAEGGTSTGIFSHTRNSLPAKTHIFYKAYAVNAVGTTLSDESSFYTLADEPSVQVSGLSATATSSTTIDLSWTAAVGVNGYIILKRQSASAPTGIPTDATAYNVGATIGDATVAAVVTSGSATSQTISGLTASTAYSFAVIAVNTDGANAQTNNYNVTSIPSATATTWAPPALSVTPATLTAFGYVVQSGPSTSQSFTLSGANLTGYPGNISVSGSANYEVSTDNSAFSASVSIPYISSTLSATTVYVRLKAGLSAANYNSEVIACSGGGVASASNVTCSGSVVPLPTTYTWNQTGTASFATAANWTPARTTPATNDILVFNGGGNVVVTGLTTQTIAQLQISNNTSLELQSSAAATLTIAGSIGTDLDIQSGSALNISQATNAITVTLSTGATGLIAGNVAYTTAAHKLTAADASGITFQSGSSFTASTGFSSNAFGTSSINSIVFASGSKYLAYAGANPFGATAPSSVVVWQAGSTFVLKNTGAPSLGNRTYANFEFDAAASGTSFTSSSALTTESVTVTTGSWSMGVKANWTVNGNINVTSGAALALNPTTAGTIVFAGSTPQSVNNSGTLSFNSFQAISVTNSTPVVFNNNKGATLTSAASLPGVLNNSGAFNLSAAASLTGVVNDVVYNATTAGTIVGTTSLNVAGLTLNVTLDAAYTPASGDVITIVTVPSGTITGTLAGVSLPSSNWELIYSASTISIKYVATPAATTATDQTGNSFTANWNAVTGATGYLLHVYTKVNGNPVQIAGSPFTITDGAIVQKAITDLTFDHYYYKVEATDGLFTSPSSNEIEQIIDQTTNIRYGETHKAYVSNGKLIVPDESDYTVYDLRGIQIAKVTNGLSQSRVLVLRSGVYIVKTTTNSKIVIVK